MNAISCYNNLKKIIELIVLLTHLSWITIYVVNNSKFLMHNIIVMIHSIFTLNTPDGSRTRIVVDRRILSSVRIPVPPQVHRTNRVGFEPTERFRLISFQDCLLMSACIPIHKMGYEGIEPTRIAMITVLETALPPYQFNNP